MSHHHGKPSTSTSGEASALETTPTASVVLVSSSVEGGAANKAALDVKRPGATKPRAVGHRRRRGATIFMVERYYEQSVLYRYAVMSRKKEDPLEN